MKNIEKFFNKAINPVIGLNVTVATASTVTIDPGFCMDSDYDFNIASPSSITIDATHVGANGVDVRYSPSSVLNPTARYNIFLIASSVADVPVGGLISLSDTPVLPSGYSLKKLLGFVYTIAPPPPGPTAELVTMFQTGSSITRTSWYYVPPEVLTGGAATSLTKVPLSGIPNVATKAILTVTYTSATPTDVGIIAYVNSAPGVNTLRFGVGTSVIEAPLGLYESAPGQIIQGIEYSVPAGAVSMYLSGFTYELV